MNSDFVELVRGNEPGIASEFGMSPPRFLLEIEITAGTQIQG